MWSLIKALFGQKHCVSCGKEAFVNWIRTVERSYFLSNKQGEKKIALKASIDVRGLCSACFNLRANVALKKVDDAFADLFPPERESAAGISCIVVQKKEGA